MKTYDKQAIEKVINYLNKQEPKCNFCEQCVFGYKNDKISKQLCYKQQLKNQKQHKIWEQKIQKWRNRLRNAE